MPKDFYLDLPDETVAICKELLRRAGEWQLPIKRKENFVGFGRLHGFYMFWIARKDGVDYFKARAVYAREQEQEVVYYPLTAEHADAILAAAEKVGVFAKQNGRRCRQGNLRACAHSEQSGATSHLRNPKRTDAQLGVCPFLRFGFSLKPDRR